MTTLWTSPTTSWVGWDLVTWLKKRRKPFTLAVVGLLLYVFTDEAFASLIGAIIVEAGISIAEYYYKEVDFIEE